MSEKLTEWFEPSVKPTIPGIYEFRGYSAPFHYWTGKYWLHWAGCSPSAFRARDKKNGPMASTITYHLRAQWRGLAENPEA